MAHQVENPNQVAEVDIAVFMPSFREAGTIALPTKKAALGLKKFYPEMRSVIVNCDNHSDDGTREAFFGAECEIPRIYVSTRPGLRGKGANLMNVFSHAALLKAKVIVILDANLFSIKTGWLKSLIDPILNNCTEYVAPVFVRNKFDSLISKALVYPLVRTLFGRRVMQPICVDHAFSSRLNEIYLQQQWKVDDRGYKSDIRMLTQAVINQAPICQSLMAHPRLTNSQSLDNDLPLAFTYVTRAMFDMMMETEHSWTKITRSRPTAMAGTDEQTVIQAPQVEVELECLRSGFLDFGLRYREVWREYFHPDTFGEADGLLSEAYKGQEPLITPALWRRAVFEAATAYKQAREEDRSDLVRSLISLFLAKCLTSFYKLSPLSDREVNAYFENEAMCFEEAKGELVSIWT